MSELQNSGDLLDSVANTIFFHDTITSASALSLNVLLTALAFDVSSDNSRHKDDEDKIGYGKEMWLQINSPGGCVFGTFSIIDTIESIRKDFGIKVHTHIAGQAGSGAAMIAICGDERTIGINSFMLIHQISGTTDGTHNNLKDELVNNVKLMDTVKRICKKKTKMTMKKIDDMLDHDIWLDADECLKNGLVDKILCKK